MHGEADVAARIARAISGWLTWFWTRSLIRSMGAAAVFETAAETPPTIDSQHQSIGAKVRSIKETSTGH